MSFVSDFVFSAKDPSATLKMIDFGLALHLRDNEIHTDDVGTPYYMAPGFIVTSVFYFKVFNSFETQRFVCMLCMLLFQSW
jgi:serine/threonine protein kinase